LFTGIYVQKYPFDSDLWDLGINPELWNV
jgi:hypothetical protein